MRGMKRAGSKLSILLGAMVTSTAALAGTTDAFDFFPNDAAPIEAHSNNVTYSKPAVGKLPPLTTYAGFNVGVPGGNLLINKSGNAINNITIKVTAKVTDAFEKLSLHQPAAYLPSSCTYSNEAENPKVISCFVKQLKAGETFGGFTVFYVAPQWVEGGDGDPPLVDQIDMRIDVIYAEGQNGPAPVEPNSTLFREQLGLVALGTSNPTNIKSGVPKGGAKLFSGDGGIPTAAPNKKFAEAVIVPDLAGSVPAVPYTSSRIDITFVSSLAPEGADCLNGARFVDCPTFKTTIAPTIDADGNATSPETRFDPTQPPVEMTYRIDASNLKMSPPKLLSSVQLRYTGHKYEYNPVTKTYTQVFPGWELEPVHICPIPNQPLTNGMPCLKAPGFCYKKNQTGGITDLEGDCEWTAISTGNGGFQFF